MAGTKAHNDREIKIKYLKPPPLDMILSFVSETVGKKRFARFERYFGIAVGIIKAVKSGSKELPVKYWPIFYERKIPKKSNYENSPRRSNNTTYIPPTPKRAYKKKVIPQQPLNTAILEKLKGISQ